MQVGVGVALLSVSVALMYGLAVLRNQVWFRDAGLLLQSAIVYAAFIPGVLAALAGLNEGFGLHPLGVDYHQPWSYATAIIPMVMCDFLVRYFCGAPPHPYSAVSDDWLLWDRPSGETSLHHHQSPA